MSGLKVIRRRISSVKSTKQITRAMKLVSAAKLRKAHDVAVLSRNYLTELERVLGKTSLFLPANFSHPLLATKREATIKRVYVIAGERGLCGAYNANLLKTVQRLDIDRTENIDTEEVPEFITMGRRATMHAKRVGWNLVATYEGLPEDASLWPIDELYNDLQEQFYSGRLSQVIIYYTEFVSAMTQRVKREVILPFKRPESPVIDTHEHSPDAHSLHSPYCRFSPDAGHIFSEAIDLYLRAKFYQAALESKASEHAARMTAMDAATNNADDLIEKLRLHYNRARQSAITRELIDIVGGAEAIK